MNSKDENLSDTMADEEEEKIARALDNFLEDLYDEECTDESFEESGADNDLDEQQEATEAEEKDDEPNAVSPEPSQSIKNDQRFRVLFSELFDLFDRKVEECQSLRSNQQELKAKLKKEQEDKKDDSVNLLKSFISDEGKSLVELVQSSILSLNRKPLSFHEKSVLTQMDQLLKENQKQWKEIRELEKEKKQLRDQLEDVHATLAIVMSSVESQNPNSHTDTVPLPSTSSNASSSNRWTPVVPQMEIKLKLEIDEMENERKQLNAIIDSQKAEIAQLTLQNAKLSMQVSEQATVINDLWSSSCEETAELRKLREERDQIVNELKQLREDKFALEEQLTIFLLEDNPTNKIGKCDNIATHYYKRNMSSTWSGQKSMGTASSLQWEDFDLLPGPAQQPKPGSIWLPLTQKFISPPSSMQEKVFGLPPPKNENADLVKQQPKEQDKNDKPATSNFLKTKKSSDPVQGIQQRVDTFSLTDATAKEKAVNQDVGKSIDELFKKLTDPAAKPKTVNKYVGKSIDDLFKKLASDVKEIQTTQPSIKPSSPALSKWLQLKKKEESDRKKPESRAESPPCVIGSLFDFEDKPGPSNFKPNNLNAEKKKSTTAALPTESAKGQESILSAANRMFPNQPISPLIFDFTGDFNFANEAKKNQLAESGGAKKSNPFQLYYEEEEHSHEISPPSKEDFEDEESFITANSDDESSLDEFDGEEEKGEELQEEEKMNKEKEKMDKSNDQEEKMDKSNEEQKVELVTKDDELHQNQASSNQLTAQIITASLQSLVNSASQVANDLKEQIPKAVLSSNQKVEKINGELTAIEDHIDQLWLSMKSFNELKSEQLSQFQAFSMEILKGIEGDGKKEEEEKLEEVKEKEEDEENKEDSSQIQSTTTINNNEPSTSQSIPSPSVESQSDDFELVNEQEMGKEKRRESLSSNESWDRVSDISDS